MVMQAQRAARVASGVIGATRLWRVLLLVLLVAISTLAMMPRPPVDLDLGWDKLHHVLAFAALAFTASLGFPTPWASRLGAALALVLLAYGGLIELLQAWVPQRSSEWADLMADGIGIACGALIARVALYGSAKLSGARRRAIG